MTADAKLLPDVNTMIERLAARLKTAPGDIKGWQTLGWSYFHTERYREAANAYAKAAALDPSSAELKRAYEQAKAKASETASSSQTDAVGKGGDGLSVKKTTVSETMPPGEHDAIRSMVDGLAARLESSPRDVRGMGPPYALSSCARRESRRGNSVPQGAGGLQGRRGSNGQDFGRGDRARPEDRMTALRL